MRFRELTKWRQEKQLEGLLFFAQRADELLFDYTLDSYKPSALNAVSLCDESIRLIVDIDHGLIDLNNLKPVLEELSWSIVNDPVAKSLLDLPRESYILDPVTDPLQKVRSKLEVLGRTLESFRYLERCSAHLSEAVKHNKKKDIDLYARLFFTTLINIGLHKSHLYEKLIGFFYSRDNPAEIFSVDQIDDFIESVVPVGHDYNIFFLATSLISDVENSAKAFNLKFHKKLPKALRKFSDANGFVPEKQEVIVEVSHIRAADCYTAREKAERRIGLLRDLFTLYHHKDQISWNDITLVRQCCERQPRLVILPKNPIQKGYDLRPAQASQQLNRMLKNFNLASRDFHKFNRAVDFHGLSVNNSDPENQILNLWIALETIVPSHAGLAKIRQVVDGVQPFLTMNYFWRLIGRLAQDLLRWDRARITKLLRTLPDSQGTPLRKKVLRILVEKEAEGIKDEIYASLGEFHALRHRIFFLSQSISTPKKTLNVLETHEKKVAWQIRRIYRTRNLIIHSGRTPPYIPTLIENGHDYLDQVLLTISRMSGSDYKIRTIEQAFELASVARRKLQGTLSSSKAYDDHIISLMVNEHDFIW